DRGETVRIEMDASEINPALVQLAQDLQDHEQLARWTAQQQAPVNVYHWNNDGELEELHVPSSAERAQALATMSRMHLKAYKEKYQLLLLKGKLLTPAEYPCKCEKAQAVDCADDRNLRRNYCGCRCHTYD